MLEDSVSLTPEDKEQELISLAVSLAEEKLRDGTASSQIIVHYLRLASIRAELENEILKNQKELIAAKTENLKSSKRMEELYEKAINAMKYYGDTANGGQ